MNSLFNFGCLKGMFVGSLLSSALFLLLTGYITMWKTQIPSNGNHQLFQRMVAPLELARDSWTALESLNYRPIGKKTNKTEKGGKKVLNKRKNLLSIVPASRQAALRGYTILKKSWWQSSPNSKMVLDAASFLPALMQDEDAMKRLHFAANCTDFSSFSGQLEDDWSPKQVKCLLKEVYAKFGREYNWFVISPAQTFLSTLELERMLEKMDPLGVTYMGLPDHNGYCNAGPGIVLSRKALQNVVPHLDNCLIDYRDSSAEEYLGYCYRNKLNIHCHQLHKAERYFVNKNTIDLNIRKLKYLDSTFISVYPVYYEDEMTSLYQADLIRNVRYHLNQVEQIKKAMYQSSICTKRTFTPRIKPSNRTSSQPSPWISFDSLWTYSKQINPRIKIEGKIKKEMESIASAGLKQYNEHKKTKLTFSNITYGMRRNHGIRGMEYVIDVQTTQQIQVRLHMMQTHKHQLIPLRDSSYEAFHNYVNFVVPLSNVSSRFAEFMTMYEAVCLKIHQYCKMHLVVYGENDVQLITNKIAHYKSKYPLAVIKIIPGKGKFSRGKALHQGISTLNPNDLIFTCDVDMTIKRTFVNRCRQNAIQGRRIYYPEVFKYHNMEYVYWHLKNPHLRNQIDRSHGHWCWYGFGMFCMYKSDYDALGGYNLSIEGWGGEDIELANSTLRHRYEIFRAPDPAMSHRYHPRTCSKDLSEVKHQWCISSRDEEIADSRQLGHYVQYLEQNCKV